MLVGVRAGGARPCRDRCRDAVRRIHRRRITFCSSPGIAQRDQCGHGSIALVALWLVSRVLGVRRGSIGEYRSGPSAIHSAGLPGRRFPEHLVYRRRDGNGREILQVGTTIATVRASLRSGQIDRFDIISMNCRRVSVAVEQDDDRSQTFTDCNDDADLVAEPGAAFGTEFAQAESFTCLEGRCINCRGQIHDAAPRISLNIGQSGQFCESTAHRRPHARSSPICFGRPLD